MKIINTALILLWFTEILTSANEASQILIIGAGPSGIAAATYLLEHGFYNITILEAEPRIGGRIHTVRFGEANIDLGAQWCHGEKNNIVYEKSWPLNLLEHSNADYQLIHSAKGRLSDDFAKGIWNIMEDIDTKVANSSDRFMTLGDFCMEEYNKTIQRRYGRNRVRFKIAQDALEWYHLISLERDGAFSWLDTAAASSYKECEGDQGIMWKDNGYKSFLNVLMKKYPNPQHQLPIDEKILLNKEVYKIIWNDNPTAKPAVRVFCTDGSIHVADHLIFTPSIGVLKERADKLFVPNLSLKKRQAIENIGFGAVMKVFMYYENPWWDNQDSYELIWDEEDLSLVRREFPEGPHFNGRSWLTFSSSINKEKYNPKVMSIWFTGYLVPVIEELPEDVMKDGIEFILNKFLGHVYKLTKPDKILQSRWYSNPHFRGTYSFQIVKSCNKGKEESCAESDLAEPIRNTDGYPVVQFAGEATHPYYFSTVHGAVESGYREAQLLVNLYR